MGNPLGIKEMPLIDKKFTSLASIVPCRSYFSKQSIEIDVDGCKHIIAVRKRKTYLHVTGFNKMPLTAPQMALFNYA